MEQTPKNLWSVPRCSNESALVSEFFIYKDPLLRHTLPVNCAAHTHRKSQTFPHLSPSHFCHLNSQFSPAGYFHKGKCFGVTNTRLRRHAVCAGCGSLLQAVCHPPSLSPADWKAEGASLVVDVHVSNVYMTAAGCFDPRHPAPQTSHNSGFPVVLKVCQTTCPKSATLPFSQEFIAPVYELPSLTDPESGHIFRSLLLWTLLCTPPDAPHHSPVKAAVAGLPSTPHLQSRCEAQKFLV